MGIGQLNDSGQPERQWWSMMMEDVEGGDEAGQGAMLL